MTKYQDVFISDGIFYQSSVMGAAGQEKSVMVYEKV